MPAFTMAPPIKAYLAETSLRHKAVALFMTYQGGGGKCLARMRAAAEGADVLGEISFANVLSNLATAQQEAQIWARQMVAALAAGQRAVK